MIELVCLDMAGTTVEEHGLVYLALENAVLETGASITRQDVQTWMGAEKRHAITELMALGNGIRPGPSDVGAAFDRFQEMLVKSYADTPPQPIPGVVDTFATLRADGVKVALTTGFSRDIADLILGVLGWDRSIVDAVVCADEVTAGRPAPYMIHRGMELTGVVDVRAVLTAGDSALDLESGTNAGASVVAGVLTGKLDATELAAHPHTHILDSVADIPELLASR